MALSFLMLPHGRRFAPTPSYGHGAPWALSSLGCAIVTQGYGHFAPMVLMSLFKE